MDLVSKFKLKGRFWLPDGEPAKAIHGKLVYAPDKLPVLKLRGEELVEPRPLGSEPFTVWGRAEDGTEITLLGVVRTSWGFGPQRYCALQVLRGIHERTADTVKADRVDVECSHIGQWFDHHFFRWDDDDEKMPTVVPWPGFGVNVGEDLRITGHAPRSGWTTATSYKRIVRPRIRVESVGASLSLLKLHDVAHSVRSLWTLLIGAPVITRSITGRRALDSGAEPVDSSDREGFSVFTATAWTKKETKLHPMEHFVTYRDLEPHLATVLSNWFVHAEDLKETTTLLMGSIHGESLPVEPMLLMLTQALESFHRRRFQGRYMDDADYESVRHTLTNAIPATVSEPHRESLKARIKYGNELSLRNRLRDLLRALPDGVAPEFDATFINRLVDTRNYLSHATPERGEGVFSFKEMVVANPLLKGVLYVLLLSAIGVPDPLLLKLRKNGRFMNLLRTQFV